MTRERALLASAAFCLVLVVAGCNSSSNPDSDEPCTTGTYIFTPTSPAGASYTVEETYVFHSAEPNEGAGPGCADVVYDVCPVASSSGLGYDYYRNVPGATTCPNIFNSEIRKIVGSKVHHSMVGTWTTEGDFHAEGTYDAYNASEIVVESGTFTFDIRIAVP